MAIEFRCGSCQKKLKVKDELAGKKIKCPGCGKPIEVPDVDDGPKPEVNPDLNSTASILNLNLKKFKNKEFDPEDEDEDLEGIEGAVVKRRSRLKAETEGPPAVPLQPVDWVLGLLCSCIGFIYAIVLIFQGQPSRGKKLLVLTLVVNLLFTLIGVLFGVAINLAAK